MGGPIRGPGRGPYDPAEEPTPRSRSRREARLARRPPRPPASGGPDKGPSRSVRGLQSAGAGLLVGSGLFAAAVALTPLSLPPLGEPSRIVDDAGRTVALIGATDRAPVPLAAIPVSARNAIVATEDHTFWYNPGIDPISIARAALVDLRARRIVQGGSTITQQLAKNLYLTQSRTFSRKAAELFWTFSLSSHLSKRRILDLYFNTVYFGQGAYGLEAASQVYFGIPTSRLDLAQSAMLAGTVDAPSVYDPYANPKLAVSRRNWVLHRMYTMHMISSAEEAKASREPIVLAGKAPPAAIDNAPYDTQYALAELAANAPKVASKLTAGGYIIHTSVDLPLQYAARSAYNANILAVQYTTPQGVPEPEAALASLDPRTGEIRALIGGRDFAITQFNRAVAALRQPGSSFKAATYSALLLTGRYTPSSIIYDHPVTFPGVNGAVYAPHNANHRNLGPIGMRRALAISDNVAAVKFGFGIGMPTIITQARRMGITTPIANNLTSILGSSPTTPLLMARAYSSLANGGYRVDPFMVESVTDPTGHVVYENQPHLTPAYDGRVAAVLTRVLGSVISPYGTAPNLVSTVTFPAVGKTGTSNKMRDGWFVGYSPHLATAVWTGDDTGMLSIGYAGNGSSGPIWAHYMARAYALHPWPGFSVPAGVVDRKISTIDGLITNRTTPTEDDLYIAGTQPTVVSPIRYAGSAPLFVSDPSYWYFAYHSRIPTGLPLSSGPPLVRPRVWPP